MDNKKNNVILLIVIPEYLRNEQGTKKVTYETIHCTQVGSLLIAFLTTRIIFMR